jgi:hypothetical protein
MADNTKKKASAIEEDLIDLSDVTVDTADLDVKKTEEDIPSSTTSTTASSQKDEIAIGDRKAPIIMLFGPRSSGKTMTLVRLARYLRDCHYTIEVDENFRAESNYADKCSKFLDDLDTNVALSGTAYGDYLLVKIRKHGKTICQILEAPGEHYFNPKNVTATNFRPYMTKIIHKLPNRKIWVFITEAKWKEDPKIKRAYITRIENCKAALVQGRDRNVILYNKIDQKAFLFEDGKLHQEDAEEEMGNEYPSLQNIFENKNPITSLWRKYNYKFVPFCTGIYTQNEDDSDVLDYCESNDIYPAALWATLKKCIRG